MEWNLEFNMFLPLTSHSKERREDVFSVCHVTGIGCKSGNDEPDLIPSRRVLGRQQVWTINYNAINSAILLSCIINTPLQVHVYLETGKIRLIIFVFLHI